jgi:hypothetical protein
MSRSGKSQSRIIEFAMQRDQERELQRLMMRDNIDKKQIMARFLQVYDWIYLGPDYKPEREAKTNNVAARSGRSNGVDMTV